MKTSSAARAGSRKLSDGVSIVEAREKLGDLVNRAALLSERVYVTKHGKRVAALVPVEDAELLEALEDRLDLAAVKNARIDIAKHGSTPFEELARELGL